MHCALFIVNYRPIVAWSGVLPFSGVCVLRTSGDRLYTPIPCRSDQKSLPISSAVDSPQKRYFYAKNPHATGGLGRWSCRLLQAGACRRGIAGPRGAGGATPHPRPCGRPPSSHCCRPHRCSSRSQSRSAARPTRTAPVWSFAPTTAETST